MNNGNKKFSFYTPVSYDYKFGLLAIASYYDIADEILLGIDRARVTWSGNPYYLGDDFFEQIRLLDKDKKIRIIEGSFHRSSSPVENDTNERTAIADQCKHDYIIGIDSDEILLNPIEFREWLDTNEFYDFDVSAHLYTIFKTTGTKLFVASPIETTVIGKNQGRIYKKCRYTGNRTKLSPLRLLHYSWGRTYAEIELKIKNWGHRNDFKHEDLLNLWKALTLDNYQQFRNFHPLKLHQWWKEFIILDLKDFGMDAALLGQLTKLGDV